MRRVAPAMEQPAMGTEPALPDRQATLIQEDALDVGPSEASGKRSNWISGEVSSLLRRSFIAIVFAYHLRTIFAALRRISDLIQRISRLTVLVAYKNINPCSTATLYICPLREMPWCGSLCFHYPGVYVHLCHFYDHVQVKKLHQSMKDMGVLLEKISDGLLFVECFFF